MEICTICRRGTDEGELAPDGRPLCPACARLLRWFLDLYAHIEFRVPIEEVLTLDTTFHEMGADSLDTVELVVEAQEQFGVTIDDLDAERIQTVAEYLRYIRLHAKKGPGQEPGGRDPLWDRELDG
jgi:acyl carrier protein